MSGAIILDLEAVVDQDLPSYQPADAFPPPPYWKIVCIGAMALGSDLSVKSLSIVGDGKDESGQLREFADRFGKSMARVVGWNSRGYDMPVIASRCMLHGIQLERYYRATRGSDMRYRFGTDPHLDLKDYLADYGAGRSFSLNVAARLCGFPGKLDVDGSGVADMVAYGQIESVKTYCLSDVCQTGAVYLRTLYVSGAIGLSEYRSAAERYVAALAIDGRMNELLSLVDLKRFCLVEGGTV